MTETPETTRPDANLGLDGPEADDGPAIHDPNGGGMVPEFSTEVTWVDLPDILAFINSFSASHG